MLHPWAAYHNSMRLAVGYDTRLCLAAAGGGIFGSAFATRGPCLLSTLANGHDQRRGRDDAQGACPAVCITRERMIGNSHQCESVLGGRREPNPTPDAFRAASRLLESIRRSFQGYEAM